MSTFRKQGQGQCGRDYGQERQWLKMCSEKGVGPGQRGLHGKFKGFCLMRWEASGRFQVEEWLRQKNDEKSSSF